MRARIDVSEIEAQTKIRAKYLRALENEEWGLLPGPTFVKSFLRTYAQALGLDAKALLEEYRLQNEGPGEAFDPIVASPGRPSARRRRGRANASRRYIVAVSVICALIVLLVALLASGGGGATKSAGNATSPTTTTSATRRHRARTPAAAAGPARTVTVALRASGAVYVCLVGDGGRVLIPGRELQAGEATPTYRARRFLLTLGNSAVTLLVDGHARAVPASSQAIGYSITRARGRQPLPVGRLPTCTG